MSFNVADPRPQDIFGARSTSEANSAKAAAAAQRIGTAELQFAHGGIAACGVNPQRCRVEPRFVPKGHHVPARIAPLAKRTSNDAIWLRAGMGTKSRRAEYECFVGWGSEATSITAWRPHYLDMRRFGIAG